MPSGYVSDLSFWDHWKELRIRIIRCIIFLAVGTLVGVFVSRPVLAILTRPLAGAVFHGKEKSLTFTIDEQGRAILSNPPEPGEWDQLSKFRMKFIFQPEGKQFTFGPDYRTNFYYFSPLDPFLLWLKASLIVGVIAALPFILWQVWGFIRPGLTDAEKRAVIPVILAALVLFPLGAAFAFYMLRFALGFFTRYAFSGLEPRLGIMQYVSFALTMMLAAGCVFELPVVITILTWMGLLSSGFLKKYRRHAVILLFILSAFVTPPDIFTMFAIALPLLILYEISIMLAVMIEKKRKPLG